MPRYTLRMIDELGRTARAAARVLAGLTGDKKRELLLAMADEAHADPDLPGSEALSESLLAPLTQWEDTPSRSKSDDEAEGSAEEAAGASSGE